MLFTDVFIALSNMETKFFNDVYLRLLLPRINIEERICSLMGDFNINLLIRDTKPEVSKFFDNVSSHFFVPYILQPTRLPENL